MENSGVLGVDVMGFLIKQKQNSLLFTAHYLFIAPAFVDMPNLFTRSSWAFKILAKASAVLPVFEAFCLNMVIRRARWRSSSA